MDFGGDIPERSRFQKYNSKVLRFLRSELEQPDAEKKIYSHQLEALFAVQNYFSGETPERPALIVAPTGGGKSGIVSLLPYVLASPKALIISPSLTISDQLQRDFGLRNAVATESFVNKVKMIPVAQLNGFLEKGMRVNATEMISNMIFYNLIIVNAQKFGANSNASLVETENDVDEFHHQIRHTKDQLKGFTTLIVDEAHHFPATTWNLIYEEFTGAGRQIIFLTATPFRGRECEALWPGQVITYQISRQTLIDRHIIRKLSYETINCDAKQLDKIQAFILKTLSKHDSMEPSIKHKAIVLTTLVSQAKDGARPMNGVATFVTADKTTNRNLKRFEKSNSGIDILFVCGRLLEGYDNSSISLCVILRNVGVLGLFTQFVGRCIRTSKNLMDKRTDSVEAVVASVPEFNQRDNYDRYISM